MKIFGREGEDKRTAEIFYVAVVLAELLFGSKMWVMTPWLKKALDSFHHRAVQRMAGMVPKCQQDGTWVYPPIGAALEKVGLDEIGVYIACRQNMVAQYIATCHIMELCLESERKPGLCLSKRWWEKTALDDLWIRSGHAAAEVGGYMRMEKSNGDGDGD